MDKWTDNQPLFERIHTHTNEVRESRKNRLQRARKGHCAKTAYTRKQALSRCNELLSQKVAPYLRTYKCQNCRHFHLTHQPPRKNTL
jgi:hypothetical protein